MISIRDLEKLLYPTIPLLTLKSWDGILKPTQKICAKFSVAISKTSSRIYGQTDRQTNMAKSTPLVTLII